MQFKKTKGFISLLIVLCLVLSSGINAYAFEHSLTNVDETIVLPNDNEINDGDLYDEGNETTLPDEIDNAESEELLPPTDELNNAEIAEALTLTAITFSLEDNPLVIKSVEVLNRADIQILYRPEVYRGVAENGEDPDKFYTTSREINLKYPRIFNIEFTVPGEFISDPQIFLDTVDFTYGGFALDKWGNGNDLRGNTPIMNLDEKDIKKDCDNYVVSASIRVNSPYATSNANVNANIPYDKYNAGRQNDFGSGQTADNRSFFQFGPTYEGPGTYILEAIVYGFTIAETNLHIGPYDGYRSWIEINEYCQNLIEVLNGEKADLDEKPLGILAKGNVKGTMVF